jgi:hypothetical protein
VRLLHNAAIELIKDLNMITYPAFGRCIYCGSNDGLEKEHIVPYALNGSAILPKSTCRECAKITGQFEQSVLRGPMWGVRILRELKSRTKHADAPQTFPLSILQNGEIKDIQVPLKEHPVLIHFPVFSPPGYLAANEYTSGITLTGVATILFGPRPDEVAKKLGVTEIMHNQSYYPAGFARTIAKIGYSYAVAEGALERIHGKPLLLDSLLGRTDDIGRWVGTLTLPLQSHPGLLHRLSIHEDYEKKLLIVEVQLFADSQTPSYGVVVGHLK